VTTFLPTEARVIIATTAGAACTAGGDAGATDAEIQAALTLSQLLPRGELSRDFPVKFPRIREASHTRVAARVAKGGHDIPQARIRERYDRGREHLIALLPTLTEMKLYDNSAEADPDAGAAPRPKLLLHMTAGRITTMCATEEVPGWAKPIVAAALENDARGASKSPP
jgi:hypothetical protein